MTSDAFMDYIESTWRTRAGGCVLIAWTNSAIRDDAGKIVAVASVGEDVAAAGTQRRTRPAPRHHWTARRVSAEEFARTLARLQQRGSPEETGQDITDAVAELRGIDLCVLVTFDEGADARVLAVTATGGSTRSMSGETIAKQATAYLRKRAAGGPWTEARRARTVMPRSGTGSGSGTASVSRASHSRPSTTGTGRSAWSRSAHGRSSPPGSIDERLPAAIEFAAAARNLIAGPLASREVRAGQSPQDRGDHRKQAFEAVFQPIVNFTPERRSGTRR